MYIKHSYRTLWVYEKKLESLSEITLYSEYIVESRDIDRRHFDRP